MTIQKEAGRPLMAAMAAIVVLTLSYTGASAADQARLTPASVKQFLASYPAVKAIAVRRASANGQKITSGKEALAAVVQAASDKAIKGEIETAAKAHGFRDAKEWSGVGQSIAVTYAHLKLSPDDEKNRLKMEKTIAKIQKNDLLNDKAKRKLIEAIRGGADAIEPPPADNVAVVKPMVAEIDAVVKK
jgi:hypothetical protein